MEELILTGLTLDTFSNKLREIIKQEFFILTPKIDDEKLLSMDEVRKLFKPNVSKVTIIKWTKQGRLNSHRIGGRVYYKHSEIMQSLNTIKKYGRS